MSQPKSKTFSRPFIDRCLFSKHAGDKSGKQDETYRNLSCFEWTSSTSSWAALSHGQAKVNQTSLKDAAGLAVHLAVRCCLVSKASTMK